MQYFLAKTEPNTYSIDDLEKEKETLWDGVHNFTAIKVIESMSIGDNVFIYHSGANPSIVGLAKVISSPRQNPKDIRKSCVVDIAFLKKFNKVITLKEIKESGLFNDWALIKQGRLSTMEVPSSFITWLKKQGVEI